MVVEVGGMRLPLHLNNTSFPICGQIVRNLSLLHPLDSGGFKTAYVMAQGTVSLKVVNAGVFNRNVANGHRLVTVDVANASPYCLIVDHKKIIVRKRRISHTPSSVTLEPLLLMPCGRMLPNSARRPRI